MERVYLTHPVSAKWKEVLTPPCGSEMEMVYLTHLMSAKWEEILTPPCGSGMERCTYPILCQLNGKRYLPHPVAMKWK